MRETNTNTSGIRNNKMLIFAVTMVVLVIIFMYFHDQKQQRAYELKRLERRVELLEEWGMPRQDARRQGQRW